MRVYLSDVIRLKKGASFFSRKTTNITFTIYILTTY